MNLRENKVVELRLPQEQNLPRRLKVRRKKKSSCRKSKLEPTPVEQRLGETRRPVKHMVLHVLLREQQVQIERYGRAVLANQKPGKVIGGSGSGRFW